MASGFNNLWNTLGEKGHFIYAKISPSGEAMG